jgi:hypothetical protein
MPFDQIPLPLARVIPAAIVLGACLMATGTSAQTEAQNEVPNDAHNEMQNEDTAPPALGEGEAFLRVVMPVGETVRINAHNLVSAPASPTSPFATVGPNRSEIIVSDVFVEVETVPGAHYSYLWGLGGTGDLFEDLMPANADEAVLRLYNLMQVDGVELWIAGQEGAAISGLGAIAADGVVIPPGEVTAELRMNGQSLGVIEGVAEPGRALSIAVWSAQDTPRTTVFTDTYVK